jgi:hypothetical protein
VFCETSTSCVKEPTGCDFPLSFSDDSSGNLQVTYTALGFDQSWTQPVASDGTFLFQLTISQPDWDNYISIAGHLEPHEVFVDSYNYSSIGTVGMFTGWTDTINITVPASASF